MRHEKTVLSWLLCFPVAIGLCGALEAAEAPDAELIQTIVDLVSGKDPDLRSVGLQQVREEAKGPAATKRFAELLPKLSPEAQAGLLGALDARGDKTARPVVVEMLKSPDGQVRAAAVRALGSLGEPADVPLLVQSLRAAAEPEKTASRASLVRLPGPDINAAIAAELKQAKPEARVEILGVLVDRAASNSVPAILAIVADADATGRTAVTAALARLAGPEHVPGMVGVLLKAKDAAEREALEKTIMLACQRTADADKRAEPLLAAMEPLGDAQKTALLPALGRVGGAAALRIVEAAIADQAPARREAGIRALCNWPDASVAPRLLDLAKTAADARHRTWARRALIRVAPLPDGRPDAVKLDLLKKTMTMATRDDERKLVLERASAIRTIESLRWVVPYLDDPALGQQACATVVELAHHRGLREPNKAEFDQALDKVLRTSKDPSVLDRADRYKKGRT